MAELSQHDLFWVERRESFTDRRLRPTRSLHHYGVTGRRANLRRKGDLGLMQTDHFEKPVWFAALAIIVLSVLDYIFTMFILSSGGTELNLLMDHVIQQSSATFFAVKYSLTALAVLLLLSHHQHTLLRTVKVKTILYLMVVGYSSLVMYEISIISII